jgi:hypothetical protein
MAGRGFSALKRSSVLVEQTRQTSGFTTTKQWNGAT